MYISRKWQYCKKINCQSWIRCLSGYCRKHFYTSPAGKVRNRKIALSKIGDKHPLWAGNKVSYGKLHVWIRRRLPEPKQCQHCHKVKPYKLAYDLACKGRYSRDLKNWWYLCRKCHMALDGRKESARYNHTRPGYYRQHYGNKLEEYDKQIGKHV